MGLLGNGLSEAGRYEEALSVEEAELSILRRLGAGEEYILAAQNNLASTYRSLGRHEEALILRQEIYSGRLQLDGDQHESTLRAAFNYANILGDMQRQAEAKALMRKTIPVARRILGESNDLTLKMRLLYAKALSRNKSATLDDLREAATTLVEMERTARRVLGGAHPVTAGIEATLREAQAVLRARETPSPGRGA